MSKATNEGVLPEAAPLKPAHYKVVGLEKDVKEVYVREVGRSYVLADITPDQFEMLHRLGWPHVEKTA